LQKEGKRKEWEKTGMKKLQLLKKINELAKIYKNTSTL